MQRRLFLTTLSAGTTAALAGCSNIQGESSSPNDDELSEEERREKERERMKDNVLEDGKRKHGHNIYFVRLNNISPTSFRAELNTTANPVADYDIQAHVLPLSSPLTGEWEYVKPHDQMYGSLPEYNESTHEWEGNGDIARAEFIPNVELEQKNPDASVTIPKEAFHKPSEAPIADHNMRPGNPVALYFDEGMPVSFDFELDDEFPMYEPFVIAFSWEDDQTHSDRSGELVTQSQQIVRVDDNEFIYPRLVDEGNMAISPNWNGSGIDNSYWDGYDTPDVYRTVFEENKGQTEATAIRASGYGRFSEKPAELADQVHSRSRENVGETGAQLVGETYAHYFDTPITNLWSVSYEIDDSTVAEAESVANSVQPYDGSQLEDVYAMITSNQVQNHPVVQDIARQLGDVCEMMGATEPTEKLRVVADFVQYFDYAWEDVVASPSEMELIPGTAHPVVTLERGNGDCKDYTVLMNALLAQEPFNMRTSVGRFSDVDSFVADVDMGHVSTTVRMDDLEIDDIRDDDIYGRPPLDFAAAPTGMDGVEYMYVETSIPHPLGYAHKHYFPEGPSGPIPIEFYL